MFTSLEADETFNKKCVLIYTTELQSQVHCILTGVEVMCDGDCILAHTLVIYARGGSEFLFECYL